MKSVSENWKRIFFAIGLMCILILGGFWIIRENDSTVSSETGSQQVLKYDELDSTERMLGFERHCRQCHSLPGRTACGDLTFVQLEERAPSNEWIWAFIQNEDSLWETGDEYTQKINAEAGGPDFRHDFDTLTPVEKVGIQWIISTGGHN